MTTDPVILPPRPASVMGTGPAPARPAPHPDPADVQWLSGLSGQGARYLVRAPGRLDVMGGLTDYTGGLVLHWPISIGVRVGARRRDDGMIRLHDPHRTEADGARTIPLTELRAVASTDAAPLPRDCFGFTGGTPVPPSGAWIALATLVEMLRDGWVPIDFNGASLAVEAPDADGADVGGTAAVSAAALVGLSRVAGIDVDPTRAARIVQRVENVHARFPCGIADAVVTLCGEPECMTQLRCRPDQPHGFLRPPAGVTLIGMTCGFRDERRAARFKNVRTAAYMGRYLISRIVEHDGVDALRWDGHLAGLTMVDFVERFRHRLPTRLTGADFLERFGETGDPLTRVEPSAVYKVRSRTEHHVYENARAHRFCECMHRAARTGDARIVARAGELMYASHWSHGQRCGLMSTPADRIVTLLRRRGVGSGIFGAKVAGRGCGGLVVALIADEPSARATVEDVRRSFEAETGRTAAACRDSIPGATHAGGSVNL